MVAARMAVNPSRLDRGSDRSGDGRGPRPRSLWAAVGQFRLVSSCRVRGSPWRRSAPAAFAGGLS
jgi:hypothetical protein